MLIPHLYPVTVSSYYAYYITKDIQVATSVVFFLLPCIAYILHSRIFNVKVDYIMCWRCVLVALSKTTIIAFVHIAVENMSQQTVNVADLDIAQLTEVRKQLEDVNDHL